jgi:hypothetical protein
MFGFVSNKLIADIVARARNGDQVACALLAETTVRARKGDKRSAKNYKKFVEYIRKNPPVPRYSAFGRDSAFCDQRWLEVCRQGTRLADKYQLQCLKSGKPNPRIVKASTAFSGEEETDFFVSAFLAKTPKHLDTKAGFAGSVLSYAVRLQRVRQGGPISLLSSQAAWELS